MRCDSLLLFIIENRTQGNKNKKLIRRWDSERELSLRRHRTRTTKYNRLNQSINQFISSHTTDIHNLQNQSNENIHIMCNG